MLEECVARVVQLSYDPFWKTTLRIHRHTRTPQEENVQLHPHHKCARGASLHTHTVRPCGDVGHTPGARGTEQCRVCERTGQPRRHLLAPYTTTRSTTTSSSGIGLLLYIVLPNTAAVPSAVARVGPVCLSVGGCE